MNMTMSLLTEICPIDTRCCFNVYMASYDVTRHLIDVGTTSCVYRVSTLLSRAAIDWFKVTKSVHIAKTRPRYDITLNNFIANVKSRLKICICLIAGLFNIILYYKENSLYDRSIQVLKDFINSGIAMLY